MFDFIFPILAIEPVSLTIAVISALSAITSAAVAVDKAQDDKKDARKEAKELRAQGQAEAQRQRRAAQATAATQRAQFGAAGLEGVGSPTLASLESLTTGLSDSNRIIHGANKKAHRLKRRAHGNLVDAEQALVTTTATSAASIGLGIGFS